MEKLTHSVLITGASTGIGKACALSLAKKGYTVFAGVRSQKDAEALKKLSVDNLTPVFLDVTQPAMIGDVKKLIQEHSRKGIVFAGLINNAGIAKAGPFEIVKVDDVRGVFEVNVFGVISVTQAFLPLLRESKGRIINISSVSGIIANAFMTPYTASKFALEAYSDAMRVELAPWGIKVAVIEPGSVKSEIWGKGFGFIESLMSRISKEDMDLYRGLFKVLDQRRNLTITVSPEVVVKAVTHALTSRHPKTRYRVGLSTRVVAVFRLLPDRVRDWVIRRGLPDYGNG